jgi:hypothetical protein
VLIANPNLQRLGKVGIDYGALVVTATHFHDQYR